MADTGKLIILQAFNKDENADLVPAFQARTMKTEEIAISEAKSISDDYASVVVWTRDFTPIGLERSTPKVLFQSGLIPILG